MASGDAYQHFLSAEARRDLGKQIARGVELYERRRRQCQGRAARYDGPKNNLHRIALSILLELGVMESGTHTARK